jgi:hypothetical protein
MVAAMEYTGVLESTSGNNAAFVIPDDFVAALNAGRRPKVAVTVNGKLFRTSIAKWVGHTGSASARPGARKPG